MDKNDPGKSVSRPIVAPIKINSIYIDFSGYTKQQDGGSSHSHSPNRNTLVELSKSANDSANKKENKRKIRRDFNMRKYVAEKNRKKYAERGELLALQSNSNEAPAKMDESPNLNEAPANMDKTSNTNEAPVNKDESPNTNEAPVNMDESPNSNEALAKMDDLPNSNEAPANMDESPDSNEVPANMDELPDSNEAPANMDESPNTNEAPANMDESPDSNEAPANMDESPNTNEALANTDELLTCPIKLGTANPSSLHNTTVTTGLEDENQQMKKNTLEDPKGALSLSEGLGHVHIREENPVATELGNAYPAFTANWAVQKNKRSFRKRRKLRLVSNIYKITKPIGERPTTVFQVVNVIEDFRLEQEEEEEVEECSNIRIRRSKHAKKAININEGVAGKK